MIGSGNQILTVRATDEDGMTGQDTVEFPVNGRPEAPVVAILPAEPGNGEALTATIETEAVDPDGDDIVYTWAWTKQETEADAETLVPVFTP